MEAATIPEGVYLLPKVLLHNQAELLNTPVINKVFEASLLPVISPSIVPLCGHYGFDDVKNVVLVDISQGLCHSWECGCIPVHVGMLLVKTQDSVHLI